MDPLKHFGIKTKIIRGDTKSYNMTTGFGRDTFSILPITPPKAPPPIVQPPPTIVQSPTPKPNMFTGFTTQQQPERIARIQPAYIRTENIGGGEGFKPGAITLETGQGKLRRGFSVADPVKFLQTKTDAQQNYNPLKPDSAGQIVLAKQGRYDGPDGAWVAGTPLSMNPQPFRKRDAWFGWIKNK